MNKYKKLSKNEYLETFGDIHLRKEALKCALDVRKFEIELYWKRATYFWAFIAICFTGYFTLLANDFDYIEWAILGVGILGYIFSYSWYFVNRGSKFWQNNWELHVDYLEDKIIGPLYKTIQDPKTSKWHHIRSQYPSSVSKINQFLSLTMIISWMIVNFLSLSNILIGLHGIFIFIVELVFIVVFGFVFDFFTKSRLSHDTKKNFVSRDIDGEDNP